MKLSTYLIIAASYSKLIFFSGFMKVLRRQVDMRWKLIEPQIQLT